VVLALTGLGQTVQFIPRPVVIVPHIEAALARARPVHQQLERRGSAQRRSV
jgi:hypothetical protein